MIMLFQDVYDEPSHMCTVLFDRIDNVFTPWSNPISAVLMPLYHRSVHRPGVGRVLLLPDPSPTGSRAGSTGMNTIPTYTVKPCLRH